VPLTCNDVRLKPPEVAQCLPPLAPSLAPQRDPDGVARWCFRQAERPAGNQVGGELYAGDSANRMTRGWHSV